jgi:hypothetical protein
LSQAKKHAEEYGGLGIGFTRDFIINKGGRPVIYTPFEDKDGLLEASIRKLHTLFRNDDEIKHSIDCILAHVKRMSNTKITDTGSYKDYYDESEWRLVYGGKPDNEHFKQREDEPKDIFRLPFIASDVVIIIFPNEQIKDMALNDEYIKNFFSQDVPNMVTLENCDNF